MKSRSPPERSASSRSVRADWSRAIVGDLLREPCTEHAEDHAVAHFSGGPLLHPQIPPPRGTLTSVGMTTARSTGRMTVPYGRRSQIWLPPPEVDRPSPEDEQPQGASP